MDPHTTAQSQPQALTPTPSSTYAGFWRRFGAYFIDAIVLNVISLILSPIFGPSYSYGQSSVHASYVPSLFIGIIYFVFFWAKQNGQTLGDKAFGIRVAKENGNKIDITTAIIRYIGLIVSIIPLFLGVLWVIWDKKKQGWHDKMAGTVVVKA